MSNEDQVRNPVNNENEQPADGLAKAPNLSVQELSDVGRPHVEPQDEVKRAEASAEELSEQDLDRVVGGFNTLQNATSNVLKSIGEGLSTMARKG